MDNMGKPIWGAAGIGRHIGKSAAATFHLLEGGCLPARKVGGRWVAFSGALDAALRGEVATKPPTSTAS
jgi:hypothetical protein